MCEPHRTETESKNAVAVGASAAVSCPEGSRWWDKDAGRLRRTLTVVCRKDQEENFFYEEVTSLI